MTRCAVPAIDHRRCQKPATCTRRMTDRRTPAEAEVGRQVFAGERRTGAPAGAMAARFRRHRGTGAVAGFAAALLVRLEGDVSVLETPRRALFTRVCVFIDQCLGDPRLSPTLVAQAHHISVRYLHMLFRDEGVTVGGWIRACRLERCRRDLADPMLVGLPVHAVAARWGFADAPHFSRLFRAEFGMPPGEYRRVSQGPARVS
jgi:AraC-like DNA-binding protein